MQLIYNYLQSKFFIENWQRIKSYKIIYDNYISPKYSKILFYIISILLYLITRFSILKPIPCLLLYYFFTNNPAFIFASLGDFFLEYDYFMSGLISFAIANLLFVPLINFGNFHNFHLKFALFIQPFLIYAFGFRFIFVNFYIITLLNLISTHSLPTYLFVLSDLFVLAQYIGHSVSHISLPIYWLSMYLFSQQKSIITNP